MGWLKDKFAAEPIECPRGWGEVTFVQDVQFFPVFLTIQRSCPIGGVESFDCLALWRERAETVGGEALMGGHYLAEEVPDEVISRTLDFLQPGSF